MYITREYFRLYVCMYVYYVVFRKGDCVLITTICVCVNIRVQDCMSCMFVGISI